MDFTGQKLGLAPMVRVGQLPFRLFALNHGADYVWSEELMDIKLSQCLRKETTNKINGLKTIDFVLENDTTVRPIFQTCELEKGKIIAQLGTANPETAVKCAKLLENDVDAIEVNMGCPKGYSTKHGAGAALLSTPDLAANILSELVKNCKAGFPILAKIRCLATVEETLEFCRKVANTGISLLTIHARQKEERPRHDPRLLWFKEIRDQIKKEFPNLPIWLNGVSHNHCVYYRDIEPIFKHTQADGIMLARAAFRDVDIFNKNQNYQDFPKNLPSIGDLCREYIKIAIDYDATPRTIKYNVQEMLIGRFGETGVSGTELGEKVRAAEYSSEFAKLFDIPFDPRIDTLNELREVIDENYPLPNDAEALAKNALLADQKLKKFQAEKKLAEKKSGIFSSDLEFNKKLHMRGGNSPRAMLNDKLKTHNGILFEVTTEHRKSDGRFRSKLVIKPGSRKRFFETFEANEDRYFEFHSMYWSRNKKKAEQAVSVILLQVCGIL